MNTSNTPSMPPNEVGRGSFIPVLRSEWTKFRTVRGWGIGVLAAVLLCVGFTFLVANGNNEGGCTGPPAPGSGPNSPGSNCYVGHPFVPIGPNGEAVADSYSYVHHRLTGNGTVTVQVTSLTGVISTSPASEAPSLTRTKPGLAQWAKAGILLTSSAKQGSPYAAVMATGGHGVNWQYNYTHDQSGLPGAVTNSSPRWLRLTRNGNTLVGYDSTNGTTWLEIGTARLAGLPATVNIGLFVTSPVTFQSTSGGAPTAATATFDHITMNGRATVADWKSTSVGSGPRDYYPTLGASTTRRPDNGVVLSGSGDISLAVNPLAGGDDASSIVWFGLLVALIMIIVIATMFITVEYRRGLIRTTFTATHRRGFVLSTKAIIIGVVAFVVGTLGSAAGVALGEHALKNNGNFIFPANTFTVTRVIFGSGALVGVSAVAVLAIATILRKSASAVTAGIVVFVLPYVIGSIATGGVGTWLFRLTPAAGFDVLGTLPRSTLVNFPQTMANGYYPLAPWAGLAVLCAYAALALAMAFFVLRRRDA
jgi:ABC-type transport system involved in multi-copper enzyme maturation permease subunit